MRIKRLYIFLLKTFVPLFFMTFGICLFIVLMQFLWKYVDEMVGKGLSVSVLGEFFFYAALSFVPMSLPLAVLLASLMAFGNLGEQFELSAMKASGISLQSIMKPLVILLVFVSVGSFCFQNYIIPSSQVKMWTLLFSMRQKSPELEIPESTFYSEIQGYNIYVREKERNGLLRDMMIYDYSQGFSNAQVTVADSGRIKMSTDKLHLILSLWNGEAFEPLSKQDNRTNQPEAVPYQKEMFAYKELLIEFDANFNRANESMLQNRYIGKGISDLQLSIDSMTMRSDSIKSEYARQLYTASYRKSLRQYSIPDDNSSRRRTETSVDDIDFYKIFAAKSAGAQLSVLSQTKTSFDRVSSEYHFNTLVVANEEKEIRRHHTEMHKKFTLSLACLIFFFIGAPLGSIIRKGGLGMPVIISVAFFVVYYIIDRIGFTMATNGMWHPWEGMWFSSAILAPLGAFLTWKAAHDSVLLDSEVYLDKIKKFFGKSIARKVEKKEVIMYNLDYEAYKTRVGALFGEVDDYLKTVGRWIPYLKFWRNAGEDARAMKIADDVEAIVEEGNNSERNLVINKLIDFPFVGHYRLVKGLSAHRQACVVFGWILPLALPVYLIAMFGRRYLFRDIRIVHRVSDELLEIITDK
ncbi:MAG: LptF/LptG family permease [Tannerella sp.]|nr:LptF/LptG family permease [Tannerella sp.]